MLRDALGVDVLHLLPLLVEGLILKGTKKIVEVGERVLSSLTPKRAIEHGRSLGHNQESVIKFGASAFLEFDKLTGERSALFHGYLFPGSNPKRRRGGSGRGETLEISSICLARK